MFNDAHTRTAPVLGALSLEQKIELLSGAGYWRTAGHPSHGVASITLSDGPHGVRAVPADDHLGSTESETAICFPTASALACSWDRDLARRQGEAIAAEARRLGVNVVLGPGLNIKRTPLGGRNFEYFSEDPYLTGRMAAAVVEGIESGGVGACVKHFAVNNQELDRFTVSAEVDERALRELYLRGFEIAVTEAVPSTVMSAYNAVNGIASSENHRLLTEILRDEWGFDGVVLSDWGAVADRVAALRAGLDLEMPTSNGLGAAAIAAALDSGELAIQDIDRSAARIVQLAGRLADEANARAQQALPTQAELEELARAVAQQSIVLLRNENATLPLDRTGTVALVGGFADAPRFQGGGSSQVNVPGYATARQEILRYLPAENVIYARGYADGSSDGALLSEAVAAAAGASAAVLFVGLTELTESEGFDRTTLVLPEGHRILIERVSAVNPRTVVVLHKGAVVDMSGWGEKVAAILDLNLGGQQVAAACMDLLFGAVNPSGRTNETVPMRLEDTPAYLNYPGELRRVHYRESIWVGYRYYDRRGIPVASPFGHGLSYTTFAYDHLQAAVDEDGRIVVTIEVTNTGDRAGAEVVQLYVRDDECSVARPDRELRAFEKVTIEPGQTVTVTLGLSRRDLAFWDEVRGHWTIEDGTFTIEVGASSRDIRAVTAVEVIGDVRTAEIIDRHTPVRQFLTDPRFAAGINEFLRTYPMFGGDFDSLSPLSQRIVSETINSMPLEKLRLVSGGAFTEADVQAAIDSLTTR